MKSKEPEIYQGLRQFHGMLDQTVAVLNFLLDNGDLSGDTDPEEIKNIVHVWTDINFMVGNTLASDELPEGMKKHMKSETYNALAAINRGAELQLESLAILQTEGKLPPDYVEYQRQIIEETRSGINSRVHDALGASEDEDWHRFEQLRLATEARLKES